jgi:arylsulfatase A-like enzyme
LNRDNIKRISVLALILLLLPTSIYYLNSLGSRSKDGPPPGRQASELLLEKKDAPNFYKIIPETKLIIDDEEISFSSEYPKKDFLRSGRISRVLNENDDTTVYFYNKTNFRSGWSTHDMTMEYSGHSYNEFEVTGHSPYIKLRMPLHEAEGSYIAVELKYKIIKKDENSIPGRGKMLWSFYDNREVLSMNRTFHYPLNGLEEYEVYGYTIPEVVSGHNQALRIDFANFGEAVKYINLEYVKIKVYRNEFISNNRITEILMNTSALLNDQVLVLKAGTETEFDFKPIDNAGLKLIYSSVPLTTTHQGSLEVLVNGDLLETINLKDSDVEYLSLPGLKKENKLTLRYHNDDDKGVILLNSLMLYPQSEKAPNIILVVLDTLRADHLGCYGYERNTSPNMDRFAEQNVLYKNAYAQAAYTLPSHASLFTSLYPNQHYAMFRLADYFVTLSEVLKENGYYTVAVTGGSYLTPKFGLLQGFDCIHYFAEELVGNRRYEIRENTTKAISQIRNRKTPFFLLLHTYQIHADYIHPERYDIFYDKKYNGPVTGAFHRDIQVLTKRDVPAWFELRYTPVPEEDRRRLVSLYDQGILYSDNVIQGFINYLIGNELYDNSMIIITSDHGEEFYDHGGWQHGHSLYNEIVKVPLIIKYPDYMKIKNDPVTDSVELIDLYPTVLDVLGIEPWMHLEGRSLLGGSRKSKEASAMMMTPEGELYRYAEVSPNSGFKYINSLDKEVEKSKFNTYRVPDDLEEFFDLRNDPGESSNLISDNLEMVEGFRESREVMSGISGDFDFILDMSGTRSEVKLDEEVEEQLRALGYVK